MENLADKATSSLEKQAQNQTPDLPTTGDGSAGSSATLQKYLVKFKDQIELALPKNISPDRMIRVAMTAVNKIPALQKVQATTLFGCLIQSYQLGLEPDNGLGHSWILPFKNGEKSREAGRDVYEAQLIIGYQGMNELAYRSGFIKSLHGAVVYKQDPVWDFQYGSGQFLHHRPTTEETTKDDMVAAYACAELINGGIVFIVLKKSDIMSAMLRSQSRGNFGPWKTDWESMAVKTCFRRLFKKIPKSAEIAKALALEALAEAGVSQGLDVMRVNTDGSIDHTDETVIYEDTTYTDEKEADAE